MTSSSFPVLLIREFTGGVRSALSLFSSLVRAVKFYYALLIKPWEKGEGWGCSISLLLLQRIRFFLSFLAYKTTLMKRADLAKCLLKHFPNNDTEKTTYFLHMNTLIPPIEMDLRKKQLISSRHTISIAPLTATGDGWQQQQQPSLPPLPSTPLLPTMAAARFDDVPAPLLFFNRLVPAVLMTIISRPFFHLPQERRGNKKKKKKRRVETGFFTNWQDNDDGGVVWIREKKSYSKFLSWRKGKKNHFESRYSAGFKKPGFFPQAKNWESVSRQSFLNGKD